MDFLDPRKQRRHAILLYVGYVFIGIAVLISTVVLVYQANGFGVNGKGQVVQNGLVFFSSQPNPADIYLNGKKNPEQTNARLSLPAGQYAAKVSRDGYRSWQRNFMVQGGDVQNYDYPVLFPTKLTTKAIGEYKTGAGIASQSRDRRWLVVQQSPTAAVFDVHDLKDPKEPVKTTITLPASVARGVATGAQTWEAVQWADDNQHLLLKHGYGGETDYIIVDREDSSKSVNLNIALGTSPALLTLIDNKYDQYHVLSAVDGDLYQTNLGDPQLQRVLGNVLSYKSYGSNTVVFASALNAPEGKVNVSLFDGQKSTVIRTVTGGSTYLLDMAGYRGKPYVAIGVAAENTLYVYRDPVGQLRDPKLSQPVALRAIRVNNPTYVAFSPNTQYIVAENAGEFAVYDIYLKQAYSYAVKENFDAPQSRAMWMDGNRLTYVSNGKQLVFDYDKRNRQMLMPASANYTPYFASDYKYVYALAPGESGGLQLTQTPLLTPADL